jgi:hypothetical protein
MSDWQQIAVAMLELYLALGLMVIGFGYMFSGKAGGARAAQFYFGGSLRWTLRQIRTVLSAALAMVWVVLVMWIARPLGRALVRGLRALFTSKPTTSRTRR